MNTVYRAGSWFALIGPEAVVALPPDSGVALVERLWEQIAAPEIAFSDVVDALTAAGGGSFSAIPPFAAVVREGENARIAVRGRVIARVLTAEDEREITGAEVTTWSERFVPAMTGIEFRVEDSGADPALPIVAGVVRAASIAVGAAAEPAPVAEVREEAPVALPSVAPEEDAVGEVAEEASLEDSIPEASEVAAPEDPAAVPGASEELPEEDALPDVLGEEPASELEPEPEPEPLAEPESETESGPEAGPEAPLPVPDAQEATSADEIVSTSSAIGITTQDPAPSAADLDDVDDTVLSTPAALETMLPPADTIAAPLGGHTLDFSPVPVAAQIAQAVADDDGDHDGATISLAQARAMRGDLAAGLPAPAEPATPAGGFPEPVSAVPTSAVPVSSGPVSSVPGITEDPGAARTADSVTGPRIRLSSGQVVALDRTVVIGRRPRATRSSGATLPHLVAVDSPQQDISRSHLEIRPEADAVVVLDLHTTNGSTLLRPGTDPVRLHPGEQTIVVTADVIDLGDGITVAFEELP